MTPIVPTEAACGVGAADAVSMRSLANVHGREDIVNGDIRESVSRSFNLRTLPLRDMRERSQYKEMPFVPVKQPSFMPLSQRRLVRNRDFVWFLFAHFLS